MILWIYIIFFLWMIYACDNLLFVFFLFSFFCDKFASSALDMSEHLLFFCFNGFSYANPLSKSWLLYELDDRFSSCYDQIPTIWFLLSLCYVTALIRMQSFVLYGLHMYGVSCCNNKCHFS